jgi:hypothetical protein
MSLRGGIKTGICLGIIVTFCFSVSVSSSERNDTALEGPENARWNVELRLACQPTARPDPSVHRPRPPEGEAGN